MKAIEQHISGSDELKKFPIDTTLMEFKNSSEGDDYSKYFYPFSSCFFRFISKKFDGVDPLNDSQYALLEERFNQL